jgi:hypothetical protein
VEWQWDRAVPGQPMLDGNLAKMFKNEEIKQPGILAINPPTPDATLLAREVIQNSWDAGRELAAEFERAGMAAPQFHMDFEFLEWTGNDKAAKVEAFGLAGQSDRLASLGDKRSDLGLPTSSCLDHLDDPTPLRALRITERRTTGMRGPWSTGASRMLFALLALGRTEKAVGAGGSFGYGKAGLIRGSAIRSLVAYSCFAPTDEESVTRRLLGMAYWGTHELDDQRYTGFGRIGAPGDGTYLQPCEDDAADAAASALGLEVRSADGWSDDPEQLGTTFLLIDPPFDAEDLSRAIARNWWPALSNSNFVISVTGADGTAYPPRPQRDEQLRSFVEAYALLGPESIGDADTTRTYDLRYRPNGSDEPLGRLALTSGDWSYPLPADGDELPVAHRSLVALVRGPQMVVEYYVAGDRAPYLRGVFVADDDVDDLLRQTEPKAHDSWDESAAVNGADGVSVEAPVVAKRVHERIRQKVREFQGELRPPLPKPSDVRLTLLEELFKPLTGGKGKKRPPPEGERNFVLRPKMKAPKVRSDGHLETVASVSVRLGRVALGKLNDGAELRCEMQLRFVYVESDEMGSEIGTASATQSDDGVETDLGRAEGWVPITLRKSGDENPTSSEVEVSLTSMPYSPDATCRFVVDVREAKSTGSTEGEGDANAVKGG